jgi:hypothetical protein
LRNLLLQVLRTTLAEWYPMIGVTAEAATRPSTWSSPLALGLADALERKEIRYWRVPWPGPRTSFYGEGGSRES